MENVYRKEVRVTDILSGETLVSPAVSYAAKHFSFDRNMIYRAGNLADGVLIAGRYYISYSSVLHDLESIRSSCEWYISPNEVEMVPESSTGYVPNASGIYPGYYEIPGYFNYLASPDGHILYLNGYRGIGRTKGTQLKSGYLVIRVGEPDVANIRVHRLVCTAFHGLPTNDRNQVNHIDGRKTNNHYSNLEWVTPQENTRHAIDNQLRSNMERYQVYDDVADTLRTVTGLRELARHVGSTRYLVRRYIESRPEPGKRFNARYLIMPEGTIPPV